jgi:cob(I)alamin adenosyltransferase
MHQGLIQVYTGNGKGKTTAALGLALRAAGSGLKTLVIQFMKGQKYGELEAVKKLAPLITIEQMGLDTFVHITKLNPQDREMALKGLARAQMAMATCEVDILILDEITVALYYKLLQIEEVLDLLDKKPLEMELILTGRYAPPSIIARADLVTRMQCVKHYFQRGVQAREGIEK